MNKELPCYIVSDLLPFYQEGILSEQTKEDIDKHINECKACKRNMDIMKMQIDVKTTDIEIFGACYPIARLGIGVLTRGGITDYQIERLKHMWYLVPLDCCFVGIIVCVCYFLLTVLIRKLICKKRA